MKRIASFATPEEAALAKSRLEAAGIAALVEHQFTSGWFWHLDAATRGVKLFVADDDLARAERLLSAVSVSRESGAARETAQAVGATWACPKCATEVESDMEVCWACGTTAAGIEDPHFEVATAPVVTEQDTRPPSPWFAVVLVLCPPLLLIYAITKFLFRSREGEMDGQEGAAERETVLDMQEQEQCDAAMNRAWRAAIIGIVLAPPLLNIYSAGLIVWHCILRPNTERHHVEGWIWATMTINVLVFVIAALFGWLFAVSSHFGFSVPF